MRIAVIGAGGIGGWLGARLAASGQQVGFLVHGRTLEALRSGGLTLRDCSNGGSGTVTARIEQPLASEDPGALIDALGGHPDLVLVTTKVDALPELAPALRYLIGPSTGVVSTQNGVSAPDLLAAAVGTEHVLPGVARVYSAVVSPGTVRTIGSAGSLALGEWNGRASARSAAIVAALEEAGIRAWVPDSVWAELWRKVAFVVVQGALGAAANAPIGVLRSDLRDAFTEAVREVVAVATALGHDLATDDAPDPVTAVMALADAQPAGATTSMQRDIAAGRPSELDAQLGSVCRSADEVGVPTPVLDLAHAVLAPREAAARVRD
ncbi:2-dehydropantoate 2-reductase [Actinomyces viscosus]|uniref:2-dehydropantoate 2-reductase n=1 Tax=Actinomyces viscosus TaxID=1656 RepID=A0A448PJP6_ACTVI|nr:2-dehydropantoate 2-reductase [Actinomyces viscosus]TFH54094.1 2-dehydropantoate 2-reductase [Actinomyces viscosus]VEI15261.1 2-dehydropantoate 2-reductase [Actinomyces viscosus]